MKIYDIDLTGVKEGERNGIELNARVPDIFFFLALSI